MDTISRKHLQGVKNILSFNRHFYITALIALFLIICIWNYFSWNDLLLWIIITLFIYGLLMPLIISAYIYDFSGYYNLKWLNKLQIIDKNPNLFVNINAGFDETSYLIKNKFPKSKLKVFDFYDAKQHTEKAIIRARKASLRYLGTEIIKTNKIPLKDNSTDVVFLLSAAHEIRSNKEKIIFLKECFRICKAQGQVIMVEHLRDIPNFFAFSIGFTHFFSAKTWVKCFKKAGFTKITEAKFTPFMSILNCKK